MDLNGKVAVVTGASRGIGEAVAVAFAREGAQLLLVARTEEDLERVAALCREAGSPRVLPVAADLGTSEGLDHVVMSAVRAFDGFDVLVNNAGVGRAKPIADVDDDEYDRHMAVNLRAPYLLTQAAVKVLRRRGGGQVVQIASGLAYAGRAEWSLYAAAKFGLRGFTECVRQEVAREGIKVGMVAPGYTETHFFDGWGPPEAFRDPIKPEDVAYAVLAMVRQGPRSDIKEITVRNRGAP